MEEKLSNSFGLQTKRCSKCGRELPLTEFHKNRSQPDGLQVYCKSCTKERDKLRAIKRRAMAEKSGGGKMPPFSDPDFGDKTNREVMDVMVRCKRILESRGCTIHLSGEYTEVKKLKF